MTWYPALSPDTLRDEKRDCYHPPLLDWIKSMGPGLHYIFADEAARACSIRITTVPEELRQMARREKTLEFLSEGGDEYAVRVTDAGWGTPPATRGNALRR